MRPIHFFFALLAFFLLSSCNEYSCENTLCKNGGVCVDGTCDCPEGYTGSYCDQRAIPDRMRISSLTLTRFPVVKNDVTWDDSSGPDIFFRIYDDWRPVAQPLELYVDASSLQNYQFYIGIIEIENVTNTFSIKLLDYDGRDTKEDLMGELEFVPFKPDNGFPETIILDDGGPVAFKMTVEYLYNKKFKM